MRSKRIIGLSAGVLVAAASLTAGTTAAAAQAGASGPLGGYPRVHGKVLVNHLSSAAKTWFLGPHIPSPDSGSRPSTRVSFGTNVDANNPSEDAAPGQSETAIAANGARVMVAWNDATGLFVAPTTQRRGSGTGVGYSGNGGRTFTDLLGLPNNNPEQQWSGDPSVVAVDSHTFIVSSLYLPSLQADCKTPAQLEIAVSVATVASSGVVSFTEPIVVASGGNFCTVFTNAPQPNLAFLDKDFLSYDPTTRTLAVSYARFFLGFAGQTGAGQIEMKRAHVPTDPRTLSSASFGAPIVVWPEEQTVENEGAYVSVAPNGDAYLGWERNIFSNLFNGNPYIYIQAALVRAGATTPAVGGPANPRVVTRGQVNSTAAGGVKSLSLTPIPGYNRGPANDFPRVVVDAPAGRVVYVWNDASAHPLGDIWLRALPMSLSLTTPISKVNDDNSYAVHVLPAVSVRSNGSIVTSWYDRRRSGPNGTLTDYFGEIRRSPTSNAPDFMISTAPTDWNNTSSAIAPNFGDYTDSASTGTTTYFSWSDGRIGVPQPFVDHR